MTEVPVNSGRAVMLVDDDLAPIAARYKWRTVKGYAMRDLYLATRNGKRIREMAFWHRIVVDAQPGDEVDHINRNKLDNRRENLRIVLHWQNVCNMPLPERNSTGFRGVYRLRGHWKGAIRVNGKYIHLGAFATREAAALAYDAAAVRYFGEFAQPNFARVECFP